MIRIQFLLEFHLILESYTAPEKEIPELLSDLTVSFQFIKPVYFMNFKRFRKRNALAFLVKICLGTMFVTASNLANCQINSRDSVRFYKDTSKSIDKIIGMFRGRTVVIELWATWCEPCLVEFQKSRSFHDSLVKSGIALLYISVDSSADWRKWEQIIHQHNLYGVHLLASNSQRREFLLKLWGSEQAYSIPNYSIINSTGDMIIKNAFSLDSSFYHRILSVAYNMD